jgi:hypothetical protein
VLKAFLSFFRAMGRTASAHTMKVFHDSYCKKERSIEELRVLEREAVDSVACCDKQLTLIDSRLAALGTVHPNTREEGQRIQLLRRRVQVCSLKERLVETRDKILSGQCGAASEEKVQERSGSKVAERGLVDEGADVTGDVWDEEQAADGEEFDSALGGSVESDEEPL